MKHAEHVTPIAAVTSALATLLCCLPIGFAAAAATASVAAVVNELRPWRGASAVQKVLQQHARTRMRVFVVWEPILRSDFMAPTTGALRRVSDARARHYWDEDHALAKVMKRDARPPQPKEECCDNDGVLWDLVAIYPPGARWDASMPPAVVFDGPVVRITEKIEAAIVM